MKLAGIAAGGLVLVFKGARRFYGQVVLAGGVVEFEPLQGISYRHAGAPQVTDHRRHTDGAVPAEQLSLTGGERP